MENEDQIFDNELNAIAEHYKEQLKHPIKDYFTIKDGQPFFIGEKGLSEEITEKIIYAHSRAYRR